MKIFGIQIGRRKAEVPTFDAPAPPPPPSATTYAYPSSSRSPVYVSLWEGVKNQGEAGPAIRYINDHYMLRYRSEQLYRESETCRAIVDKTIKWTIDRGLKLKMEPKVRTLEANGIKIDHEKFSKPIEELWELAAHSTLFDMANEVTMGEMSAEIMRKALVGGDVLVVNRVGDDGFVKKQIIDGSLVINPWDTSFNGVDNIYVPTGNRVRKGVEIDAKGRQVAYHVRYNLVDTERIPAYGGKTGIRMAYLVYGVKDTERGLPLISSIIEMAKKMERYLGASLAGVEARAQIDYFIETQIGGSNENAFQSRGAIASLPINPAAQGVNDNLAVDINGIALANKINATTNHQTIALPVGQTIKSVESSQEANVAEFGGFIIDVMCAVCDIPPDVVFSKYNGSFSASRMAAKDGERSFGIRRERFANQDLDRTLELQMFVWVNSLKVDAPGYIMAIARNDQTVIQSYLFCRWVGSRFPDIDPLKTANALRRMLGSSFDHVPLTTAEAAAEEIEQGDWTAIIAQAGAEYAATEAAGIPNKEQMASEAMEDMDGAEEDEEEQPAPKKETKTKSSLAKSIYNGIS